MTVLGFMHFSDDSSNSSAGRPSNAPYTKESGDKVTSCVQLPESRAEEAAQTSSTLITEAIIMLTC